MAATLRTRIARAVKHALLERDRAEMQAVDRLVSLMAPGPQPRSKSLRRRNTRQRGRETR
jgi:hypothetical protein